MAMLAPSDEKKCLPLDHVYVVATKQVKGVEDVQRWETSEAYQVTGVHFCWKFVHYFNTLLLKYSMVVLLYDKRKKLPGLSSEFF